MYEIVGTRANSAFRVGPRYFYEKRSRFAPGIDPTTGGPVALVMEGTDDQVVKTDGKPDWSFVTDPRDPNYGKVKVKGSLVG